MLPTTLWGKAKFEVAESVIRRLQNTSSWTGSEAECRDPVFLAPNASLLVFSNFHSLGIADKVAGKSFNTRGPSDNSGSNMVSSVYITIGDPDTPWHPQFFRVPAFDQRQSLFYPSHALRQSDVRTGERHDTALRFLSRFLLVHNVVYSGMSCLDGARDSNISAKERKFYFGSFILVGAIFVVFGTFTLDIAFRASSLRSRG